MPYFNPQRPKNTLMLVSLAATLALAGCDSSEKDSSSESQAAATSTATSTATAKAKAPVSTDSVAKTDAQSKAESQKSAAKKAAAAKQGLPAIPDFASITDVKQKKQTFFDFMYDLVKRANREVLAERATVDQWNPANGVSDNIAALIEKYRVEETLSPADAKKELLKRVQVIPASLVLAQGANESAWGTSRFAKQGNNYFGQWCFVKGCGLVPKQRNDGAVHEVADFDHPMDSVRSYILNLNRHYTYDDLRNLRAKEIAKQGYATGINLAAGLINYSERREEYVKEIRSMISYNKLDKLDPTMLADIKAPAKEG